MKKYHISDKAAFACLSVFAFVIVLLISPDSYTHDVYFRVDSGCFFTAGKAWMSGMTPYVDFADSKGPLLWLIYGLGYLISHDNYIGVFWISCVVYAFTYYLTFKAAKLIVGDSQRAFLCAVLMSGAFFFPHVFYEMRAENFGHPFMMLTLYHTLRLLLEKDLPQRKVSRSFFAYGIAFGATMLIKYSFTVMLAPMMCYGLYWLVREKRKMLLPILSGVAGLAVVVMPFVIYFLVAGNFGAFVQEYFLNTFRTVQTGGNPLVGYLHEWGILKLKFVLILFVLLIVGAMAMSVSMSKYRLFPIVSTLFMFAIAVRHSGFDYRYYFTAPCICLFFLICFVVSKTHFKWRPWALAVTSFLFMMVCVAFSIKSEPDYHHLFWENDHRRLHFYNMAQLIGQVEHPKVIDLCNCGIGIETLPEALPACKYWIMQHGATPEMNAAHRAGLESGEADFIFVKFVDWVEDEGIKLSELEKLGYHLCYNKFGLLYTKHDVRLPKPPHTPSNLDILLKRPWKK